MINAVCQVCGKEYSIQETKRVYGDMGWIWLYCSAQCYTKVADQEEAPTDYIPK